MKAVECISQNGVGTTKARERKVSLIVQTDNDYLPKYRKCEIMLFLLKWFPELSMREIPFKQIMAAKHYSSVSRN